MHSYADVIEMKRAKARNYAFIRRVIEMKRMSVTYSFAESFKCECEISSMLSSYSFFSPRRIEGGVNLDYVPNNIRANNIKTISFKNIKMKLVSNNKNKTEYPVKQSNSRNFICNFHTFSSESSEL